MESHLIDILKNGIVADDVPDAVHELRDQQGNKTVNDEEALRTVIEDILINNPQSVSDYKGGKAKALGFLVGQTMKAMKGKADPGSVNRILKELLHKA